MRLKPRSLIWLLTSVSVLICSLSLAAAKEKFHISIPETESLPTYVIYIAGDAASRAIAGYYSKRHQIDAANLLGVNFPPDKNTISSAEFSIIRQKLLDTISEKHAAQFVLTFPQPYRVGCMSITSAFAFGYDESFCSKKTCDLTAKNPYYSANDNAVLAEKKIIPTMMLAANTFAQAKALIDRGVAAQNNWPQGQAYLVETKDQARSVRKVIFPDIKKHLDKLLPVNILQTDGIKDKQDILFYFTGAVSVPHLETLGFLPGAVADHLTSAGGQLTDSSQMSAMRWLEAGATGSYGTVVEPCSHLAKFPDPRVLMYFYTRGNTLMEAYWKSVLMPGEGVFIGDPLARPFGGYRVYEAKDHIVLRTYSLMPGVYRILVSESVLGPFRATRLLFKAEDNKIEYKFPKIKQRVLKIVPVRQAADVQSKRRKND